MKRAMIAAARRTVLLADHTKIGNDYLARFGALSDLDVLITDTGLDDRTWSRELSRPPACGWCAHDRHRSRSTPAWTGPSRSTRSTRGAVIRAAAARLDPGGKGVNVSRACSPTASPPGRCCRAAATRAARWQSVGVDDQRLTGLGVSPGVVVGPVCRMGARPELPPPGPPPADPEAEAAVAAAALDTVAKDLAGRAVLAGESAARRRRTSWTRRR